MKPPIFFDHMSSYHPLQSVMEVFKKPLHPHAFSWMHSKEIALKTSSYIETLRRHLGMRTEGTLHVTLGGGAAAIDQMIRSFYLQEIFSSGKQHVIMAHKDESLYAAQVKQLEILGVVCQYVPLNHQGHITLETLQNIVTSRTSLISCSWADPLTGIIQPVADIAEFCHTRGIFCHIDASHVIGKLHFNLADLPIDYMTFDTMPFHGPYSVGGVVAQNKGSMQLEQQALPLQLEALDIAWTHAQSHLDEMHLEVARLRLSFEKQILENIPHAQVLCQDIERLPHVSVITFPYIHNEYFLYLLRQDQLYASIGGGESMLLEHLLKSMGITPVLAQCALSFSFSYKTTQEEVNNAVQRISERYAHAQTLLEKVYP